MRPRRFCPFCASPLAPVDGAQQACSGCGEPFWHNAKPCVAVLVVSPDGQLMLGRRAIEPRRGLWDLPGGFLDPREVPEEAAVRELREEAGVEIEIVRGLGHVVDAYGDGGDLTLNTLLVARIVAGTVHAADDVAELAWFDPDGLPPAGELAFANTAVALERWRREER